MSKWPEPRPIEEAPGDRTELANNRCRIPIPESPTRVVMTRVPSVSTCPIAYAAINHYLHKAIHNGTEMTVEGCLAAVLDHVIKEYESLSLRFGDYIAKFGQTQIKVVTDKPEGDK